MSTCGVPSRSGGNVGNKITKFNAKAKHFWAEFSHDKEKQAKILADRSLRREIKRILDTNRPYAPAAGLLDPKPEPVNEVPEAGHFSYRFLGDIMSEGD